MRILYIYNINRVAQTVGSTLASHGYAVCIFEPSLLGASAALPTRLWRMPQRVLSLRHVVNMLNTEHFDLVHIHWASYGIVGLVSRIPFIIECHGSDVRYRTAQPFFRSLLAPAFGRAQSLLCITPDLLAPVQSLRSDALFFPGPVDTDRFVAPEDKTTHPWTILLFTRLDPIKGPGIAVEGIARFAARHPSVLVQLLDWGLLKAEYKERYGRRFEFLPPMPSDKVQHLINAADVIVGQSKLGILSFCELQAMSCEKPVICPFHYDSVYADPPPIFRANNAEQIDQQLEFLYHNPDIARTRGKQARSWVIEHHGLEKVVLKLKHLYQEVYEHVK